MLLTSFILGALGMILLPLIAGFIVARKFGQSFKNFRRLFQAGALTFIASQVLHIPLVQGLTKAFSLGLLPSPPESIKLLFNAILLGLLAGIFEETARYILFKKFLKNGRTWKEGFVVGLGHGGIEAILFGILSIVTLTNMIALHNADLSAMGIPADQINAVKQQVDAFWSTPLYMPIIGLLERAFAIMLHISLSIFVLYSVITDQCKWFWYALLWHALVDALAVYLLPMADNKLWGILGLEAIIAMLTAILMYYAVKLPAAFGIKSKEAE